MTLLQLTTYWQTICLKHKDVLEFQVGSWYDAAANTGNKYPLCFWELPYSIQYPDITKPKDTVQISFSVFLSSKPDSIADDNQAISMAKSIGDAIIMKARLDTNEMIINAVNAVSVREYTDDNVAGIRYDLTLTILNDICEKDLNDYFN